LWIIHQSESEQSPPLFTIDIPNMKSQSQRMNNTIHLNVWYILTGFILDIGFFGPELKRIVFIIIMKTILHLSVGYEWQVLTSTSMNNCELFTKVKVNNLHHYSPLTSQIWRTNHSTWTTLFTWIKWIMNYELWIMNYEFQLWIMNFIYS